MIRVESLHDLKARVEIVDFVEKLGFSPKRAGSVFFICCPFHHENTPSLALSPHKNTWRCYGCGRGGDVINFVEHLKGYGFYDAAFEVARITGFELEITHHTKIKPKPGYDILAHAHKLFQEALLSDMFALSYLQKRGIDQENARYFELGLCTPEACSALKKVYDLQALQECGLFNKSYCFFEKRLSFAYKDNTHRVVGFSARTLEDAKPKYINSRESDYFKKAKTLWNLDRALNPIIAKKQIIITEGFFDAMLFKAHGYPNAVCISGTSFTQEHLEYLGKIGSEILFCLDNDTPGQEATLRALETCFYQQPPYARVGVICFVNPSVKDMGSCYKKKPEMRKQEGFKYLANARLSATLPPQERDKNYQALIKLISSYQPFLKHHCLEILSAHAPKEVRQEVKASTRALEHKQQHLKRKNPMWPEGRIFATMLEDIPFRFVVKSFLSAQDFEYPKVYTDLINNITGALESLKTRFIPIPLQDQSTYIKAFKHNALKRDLQKAIQEANYSYANALEEKIKDLTRVSSTF
ncbi:DNA primase [Helicobacter felis]|uniref:DNA primase n=1 Tax=Helicobacter felis TaxID=214 RepID=UPI001315A98A|nr:DNA primase [Helicobacter felis]